MTGSLIDSVFGDAAAKGVQGILLSSEPERFFVPKYVGPKGWVGVRLDLRAAPDWDEMAEMIAESYCLIAPKRLAALVVPGAG